MKPIEQIAAKLGIKAKNLEKYGEYKAKLFPERIRSEGKERGKLI
ncbi:MAG: formate--tetrahydrofolate ligase, partial [Candidatus Aminicenantaceae bacterium]